MLCVIMLSSIIMSVIKFSVFMLGSHYAVCHHTEYYYAGLSFCIPVLMLSVIKFSVFMLGCHYTEFHHAECHFVKLHHTECHQV